jgi:hypothetical protein
MPDELNGVETGLHALLHGDAVAAQQAEKMLRWVVSQGSVKAGYHLGTQTSGVTVVFSHPTLTLTLSLAPTDGRPIGDYFSTFFASPFAVAAMVAPSAQSWLNKVPISARPPISATGQN